MILKIHNYFLFEERLIHSNKPSPKELNQSVPEEGGENSREIKSLIDKISDFASGVIEEEYVEICQGEKGGVADSFLTEQNEPTEQTLELAGLAAVEIGIKVKKLYPKSADLRDFIENEQSMGLLRDTILKTFAVIVLRKKIELLQEQGGYDILMEGFLNTKTRIGRDQYEVKANEILRKSAEKGENASLLYLDLDHFKPVNDEYGHGVGDVALSHFGKKIKEALRERIGDICVRDGGEEIVILLNGCDEKRASVVAERIRKNIEDDPLYLIQKTVINGEEIKGDPQVINYERFDHLMHLNGILGHEEGRGLKVIIPDPRDPSNEKVTVKLLKIPLTASIGIAQCSTLKPGAFDEAKRIADEQVYEAKTNGRNQIFCRGKQIGLEQISQFQDALRTEAMRAKKARQESREEAQLST